MQNNKYPHFEFNKWIAEYAEIYHGCIRPPSKRNFISDFFREYQQEHFKDMQTYFINGVHLDDEYEFCPSCEYAELLTDFNEFMSILSRTKPEKHLLLNHFAKKRPSANITDIEAALDNLLKTLDVTI